MPISIGAEIYYAESIDRLSANMLEVHPTMMAAVPRLYENMYQRIVSGVERKGGLSAKLFNKTIALGIKEYEQGSNKLNFYEKIQNQILSKLVRAKVAARFGGKLKAFISGGAPLNYDIGIFFHSEISQSMVYVDKRSHLVAVIYPSEEFLSTFKENDNLEPNLESIKNLDSFQQKLKKAVDKVNTNLSQIEQIRRFIIANESFTIDNGLMTPTLKPRRHQITKIYGDRLDDLYGRSKKD